MQFELTLHTSTKGGFRGYMACTRANGDVLTHCVQKIYSEFLHKDFGLEKMKSLVFQEN